MTNKFNNLKDASEYLGDDEPLNTIEELVDTLVRRGNTPKVYAYYDEHLGLKRELSKEFLKSSVNDDPDEKFHSEAEMVLEQANEIISLSEKELSEDDVEDIKEEMEYQGHDTDDMKI